MDIDQLARLLTLLRQHGVDHYRDDGLELRLGSPPDTAVGGRAVAANNSEPDGQDVGFGIRLGARK